MGIRSFSIFMAAALLASAGQSCSRKPKSDYPVSAVPLTAVHLTGGFWANRQQTDINVTIAHEMRECEETGRIKNFELAAAALQGAKGGKFATSYAFDDSDVYKVIEAASYVLMLKPDAALEKKLDGWIAKIAAAQEPDGYLYTARTIDPQNPPDMSGKERWTKLRDSHELYNLGHLYEAAVAYHEATGKRNLLEVALKSANLVRKTFGPGPNRIARVPGHEEIELALVKLYRLTKDMDYLDLAGFFIDQRGNSAGHPLYGEYNQDHRPVLDQREAVGHSVRAGYLYSGMTDVAALSGDPRYIEALDAIWQDIVAKKLYLTGGIGAAGNIEGFGPAYDLPNATGYAETCATIAFALWNWRMFLYHGDGKYMDLFERAAFNAFLSGDGLSGDRFFYPNPLASDGRNERSPWFRCACCPPNAARFIAQMGSFVYGVGKTGDSASGKTEPRIYINLYAQSTAELQTAAGPVVIEQKTDYPWNGEVQIRVAPRKGALFSISLRIPRWAQGNPMPGGLYTYSEPGDEQPSLKVNGEPVPIAVDKGYMTVHRSWRPEGDIIELSLPMKIHRVHANPQVAADSGRVAIERGPLVYCAEWPDNGGLVSNLVLNGNASLTAGQSSDPPEAMMRISGAAVAYNEARGRISKEERTLQLIPYYAWAHRGRGEMEVWIASEPEKAKPGNRQSSICWGLMNQTTELSRRRFMHAASVAVGSAVMAPSLALSQSVTGNPPRQWGPGAPPTMYPDPDIIVVDQSFGDLMLGITAIRRVWTGSKWAEGPAWSGQGRYLVFSDVQDNTQYRYLWDNGEVTVFRRPSFYSNGNSFDFQGRQLSAEHYYRRVVRWEHDGSMSVIADSYEGKHLNSPNDLVPHPDGSIWFTDPPYGTRLSEGHPDAAGGPTNPGGIFDPRLGAADVEGLSRKRELPTNVYRRDPSGKLTIVVSEEQLPDPNGLCFSPDYKTLYIASTGKGPGDKGPGGKGVIYAFDVQGARLANQRLFTDMTVDGVHCGPDGLRADVTGHIWCSSNAPLGHAGVLVFNPQGKLAGQIRLPEVAANLAFGGPKRDRLFITASQSLYVLQVQTQGAAPG